MENVRSYNSVISNMFQKIKENRATRNLIILFTIGIIFLIWTINGIRNSFFIFEPVTIIIGTLFLGSVYLCMSLGLNMTYKLINFANFAHAEYFVLGAYIGIYWNALTQSRDQLFVDYFIVIIIAFIISGIVAVLGDKFIFEPLRDRGSTPETMMITSIGWGIILRNFISMFFGGESEFFNMYKKEPIKINTWFFGFGEGKGFFKIEPTQYGLRFEIILAIIMTSILVTALFMFLEKTKVGTALRATSDNIDLAESSGINTLLMTRITWMIGGGLAGVAGVIFVSRIPVIPYTGFLFLLPAFAVIVLGGIGSLKGSVVASIIIAFSQTLAIPYLVGIEKIIISRNERLGIDAIERTGLSAYSIVVPFIILISFILFKPTGLYGEVEA